MKVKNRNYFLCQYCGELFSCSGRCFVKDKDFCLCIPCGIEKLKKMNFSAPVEEAKILTRFCEIKKEKNRTIKFLLKLKEKRCKKK